MSLIRKIIEWFKKLFRKLFGQKKIRKKINNGIKDARNKRYLKGYGIYIEDSYTEMIPPYLIITREKKKKIKAKIEKVSEIIDTIEENEELKKSLNEIITTIDNNIISIYQEEKINENLELFLSDKNIRNDLSIKLVDLNQNISEIVKNYGKKFEERVSSKYEEVNYVTITNVILDDTYYELAQLEADFRHHKYNKYYYNRKLNRLLERIDDLKKMRDFDSVKGELLELRDELYTKSKDKYDLLFNTEVFDNIENECNDLLQKVNWRIIDIKKADDKENNRKKKQEEQQAKEKEEKEHREKERLDEEQKEQQENILKRFKDLELARQILLLSQKNNLLKPKDIDLLQALNQYYYDFLNGEKAVFFFDRNRTKTELVKLYNNLNYIESVIKKQDFILTDHINFRMEDLIEESMRKKDDLETLLAKKTGYDIGKTESSIMVNSKMELIRESEIERRKSQGPVKTIRRNDSSLTGITRNR